MRKLLVAGLLLFTNVVLANGEKFFYDETEWLNKTFESIFLPNKLEYGAEGHSSSNYLMHDDTFITFNECYFQIHNSYYEVSLAPRPSVYDNPQISIVYNTYSKMKYIDFGQVEIVNESGYETEAIYELSFATIGEEDEVLTYYKNYELDFPWGSEGVEPYEENSYIFNSQILIPIQYRGNKKQVKNMIRNINNAFTKLKKLSKKNSNCDGMGLMY